MGGKYEEQPTGQVDTNVAFFNAMEYSMALKNVRFVVPLTSEANLRFARS